MPELAALRAASATLPIVLEFDDETALMRRVTERAAPPRLASFPRFRMEASEHRLGAGVGLL